MVTINCIPTSGISLDPLFEGISMSGVDLAHQALVLKNEAQKLIVTIVVDLFNAVLSLVPALGSDLIDLILDLPIPGTPFTIRDVLFTDYAELVEKIKDYKRALTG